MSARPIYDITILIGGAAARCKRTSLEYELMSGFDPNQNWRVHRSTA